MRKKTPILTREEIIDRIKLHRDFLATNYHLTEIGLFGSCVRGEQNSQSDIDILIDYDRDIGISLFDMVDLSDFLTQIMGYRVDLVLKRSLKPVIGKFILDEVIYI